MRQGADMENRADRRWPGRSRLGATSRASSRQRDQALIGAARNRRGAPPRRPRGRRRRGPYLGWRRRRLFRRPSHEIARLQTCAIGGGQRRDLRDPRAEAWHTCERQAEHARLHRRRRRHHQRDVLRLTASANAERRRAEGPKAPGIHLPRTHAGHHLSVQGLDDIADGERSAAAPRGSDPRDDDAGAAPVAAASGAVRLCTLDARGLAGWTPHARSAHGQVEHGGAGTMTIRVFRCRRCDPIRLRR